MSSMMDSMLRAKKSGIASIVLLFWLMVLREIEKIAKNRVIVMPNIKSRRTKSERLTT